MLFKLTLAFTVCAFFFACNNESASEKKDTIEVEKMMKSDSAKLDSVERYWKEKMGQTE